LEEEFEEEEDQDQVPEVPLNYVLENLQTMNYTFEDMVKILLNDFLDNEQDERSSGILQTVDNIIGRYEEDIPTTAVETTATAVETTATAVETTATAATAVIAPAPNTYDEDSDSDDEVSDDIKKFVPKINFNVVKRYQATSWLCGNN
jgi:hypothetical protein